MWDNLAKTYRIGSAATLCGALYALDKAALEDGHGRKWAVMPLCGKKCALSSWWMLPLIKVHGLANRAWTEFQLLVASSPRDINQIFTIDWKNRWIWERSVGLDTEGSQAQGESLSSDIFSLDDQRNSRTLNRNRRGKRRAVTNDWKSSMEVIGLEDTYRGVLIWSLKGSMKSPELT